MKKSRFLLFSLVPVLAVLLMTGCMNPAGGDDSSDPLADDPPPVTANPPGVYTISGRILVSDSPGDVSAAVIWLKQDGSDTGIAGEPGSGRGLHN